MKMTNNSIFILLTLVILFSACKEDKTIIEKSYSPNSVGSTWNYKGFITESTSNRITGKTVVKFDKTYYEKEVSTSKEKLYFYGSRVGDDYYSITSNPNNISQENEILYLKANANVGDTWVVDIKYGSEVLGNQWQYKIIDKGITKTVNGNTYTDVIHTERFSDGKFIQSYYCLGVGLIEVDYEGGANSILQSYTIK